MALMTIVGLEGGVDGATVHAQFNPKEVSVDRVVTWQQQPRHTPGDLEFVSGSPQTMSFELMFDGFESGTPVQPVIALLQRFSSIDPGLKRPPKVRVSCGSQPGVMPVFEAVIETLSVRYLMLDPNGVVLRATAALRLKEAGHLKVGQPPQ